MAEEAAEAMYSEKERRFGVRRPPFQRSFRNDRGWNGFLSIGDLCLSNRWRPYEYVRFCIDMLQDNGSFVVPTDLLDDRLKSAFKKARENDTDRTTPESEWRFNEQELYKRAGEDREAGTRFLMSPLYPFPAWYRFFKGNGEIRKAWGSMAADSLRRRPDVSEWLSEKFPKRMEMLNEWRKE